MLKGNLATRPFYNERVVSLAVTLAILVGAALTIFNAVTVYRLSGDSARQQDEYARTNAEATRIRASADTLKRSVDRSTLLQLANATREANELIVERTFSWTVFFGLVEKTLPRDARLLAVSPRVERGVRRIQMLVNIKAQQDLEDFIDALLETGAFYDLLPAEQQRNEDGTYTATLSGAYLTPAAAAAAAAGKGSGRP